jgi:hypothetical protein
MDKQTEMKNQPMQQNQVLPITKKIEPKGLNSTMSNSLTAHPIELK